MKSILTLLTAFVLFGLTFTLSSCKNCSKDRNGNTPSGDNAATLDAGNGKSKTIPSGDNAETNVATLDAVNGKNKIISSGDNTETLDAVNGKNKIISSGDNTETLDAGDGKSKTTDVDTGMERLKANALRVAELAKEAKQEEQNAENAAKRGWDAALVKVVVDVSNENKVEETRTAGAEANTAQETALARKNTAVQLAKIEKVWDIKETDDMGRRYKETIKNAVLETVEASANAEQWADVAYKAKYSAENVDWENVDAGVGARARWAANDAAIDADVARDSARYAADQVTAAVQVYDAKIASGEADGQGVWEAIIDVKYKVALVKANYVAAKYYADMAKAFVDKAKERNIRVVWKNGDKVALAQEHVAEVAEYVKRADDAAEKVPYLKAL